MQIYSISLDQPQFPELLRHIHKPPKRLNVLGTLPEGIAVAIVGTRKSTRYGDQMAYQLAGELAQAGAVIVSGLALGIDGIAQRAALDAGGKTVAVLAHGLHHIYPAANRGLARDILAGGGALITEYDTGTPPEKFRFVERNRIIAGLCHATIVIESGPQGGSLITARDAKEAGRLVMAVPGNITSTASAGTNSLIRTGAIPITSATDVITELGFEAQEATPVPAQSPDEAKILELIRTGTTTNQDLIAAGGFTAASFANIISLMEITGKVRNLGAGRWVVR